MPPDRPPPRIVFAGTPDFAVPALVALADGGAAIELVLTQPDRPAGRGRRVTAPPVKQAALERGLDVAQPGFLPKRAESAGWLTRSRPDVVVVVAYGLLLPAWMLEWPRAGCVNVHASLLPRWRGAAPIQHAILAGDAETGVSLMRMEAGLDTGPVYAARQTPIGAHETGGTLHDRLARLGARLLADELPRILDGSLEAVPQDDSRSTHAPKIDKADGLLDWRQPAAALERRVRAFNPWPVAFARTAEGRTLRIFEASLLPDAPGASPGDIVAADRDGIDVKTGDGVLRLERVQPPSSRVMDAGAYLAAHSMDGVRFV
ncbi:MAG: methionyl-tRNA formyltransferase [Gammaproteobacteria bacterium]|nr:methionyl-tRNA formyltransferase [Gammaproteobacteria bacterium]